MVHHAPLYTLGNSEGQMMGGTLLHSSCLNILGQQDPFWNQQRILAGQDAEFHLFPQPEDPVISVPVLSFYYHLSLE